MTLVGDHRQSTYRTNNSVRNKGYAGVKIKKKFEEWKKVDLCKLAYEPETHRCNQSIADLADRFFPEEPKTISLNLSITGHDGVFGIYSKDVGDYVTKY